MTAPAASEIVRREWSQQVRAEYRSSALTQHLGLWLTQIGASPDLLRGAMRIASDELDHAELAHAVSVEAGQPEAVEVGVDEMQYPRHEALDLRLDVATACIKTFCLGETLAVRLFSAMRSVARVEVACTFFDRVLVDEVRHRDFGWLLLEWLLQGPDEAAIRERVGIDLPAFRAQMWAGYVTGAADREVGEAQEAWGLIPTSRYAEVIEMCQERDLGPRFARLGVAYPG